MSKNAKIDQLKTIYQQFKDLDFDTFFADPGVYTEWEGLSLDEFKDSVEYISATYDEAFEKNIFNKLPFASLNALFSSLNNTNQHCPQLFAHKQQGQFQKAAQQVDSVVHQLMIYDVNYYLIVGEDIDEIKDVFEVESQKLTVTNAEIETLKNSVQSLIEPAVSGSLSKSFSDRKSSLFHGRIAWGIVAIIFAVIAIVATFKVSEAVIESISVNTEIEAPEQKRDKEKTEAKPVVEENKQDQSLSLILLRSVVLIPIYLGFGFAFSQYRKERELEEEYAHKAAVATTLPNYGDLAKDDSVKDQIVTGASNVIFASPIYREQPKQKDIDVLGSVKDLFESAGKVFKRGE